MESVRKSFDGLPVLEDINFTIGKGERVSIVGPGGCGKSTILKILLGLIKPEEGKAELFGEDLPTLSAKEISQLLKKVGMAFQQGGLFDFMTVRDNLLFAMEHMTNFSKDEMENRIVRLLDAVKLGRTDNMYPHELSGGMKRRIGIARALCTDPSIAIFDEPTSGLDPVTSTIIMNMIKDLGSEDPEAILLIATTNVEVAVRFAERIIVVHEGCVVADGAWKKILVDGDDWVRHFLGVRFIGLDLAYAQELKLPQAFIDKHW
ncbi:MAG: ATP-binding cassette domain-containing protein [Bdellovibrionota bacterium]